MHSYVLYVSFKNHKMKKLSLLALLTILFGAIYSCNNSKNNSETILTGEATVLVDETIFPVIEDQKNGF